MVSAIPIMLHDISLMRKADTTAKQIFSPSATYLAITMSIIQFQKIHQLRTLVEKAPEVCISHPRQNPKDVQGALIDCVCIFGMRLWKGEHVPENRGALREDALVDFELDILCLQDYVAIVAPDIRSHWIGRLPCIQLL